MIGDKMFLIDNECIAYLIRPLTILQLLRKLIPFDWHSV